MTKRSERLAPVQRVLVGTERERARELGTAQQGLGAAESKLLELQKYHSDYVQGFEQRARAGRNAMTLRDYQHFLGRLEEAIRQQQQIVAQARQGVAGSTQLWQSAAQRTKAVASIVHKWQGDERRLEGRIEQKESDERGRQAQRGTTERRES